MSKTTDSISSTCVLCCQAIKTYAVGPCDHQICLKCSTKMRVLCEQKYCAVCRTDMPKVIFTQKLHPYQGIISHKFPIDRKYGIAFATSKVQEEYRRLQDHRCTICSSRRLPETNFKDLQDHMRKEHEMFYCELCIKHLQVFTHERKCYNRRDLGIHKRKGDPDDTSYRGHPLCEFCDERYFDSDELLKHLRRQHYFCHFCETDGASNQYYDEYVDLKQHFKEDHFLCEEDQCLGEKFTHAFRSEIDLKAHKAKAHAKNMTRAQVRQARQLDVDFSFPPRPRDNRGMGGSGRGRGRGRYDRNDYDDTTRAVEASIFSATREEHVREAEARKEKRVKATPTTRDKKVAPSGGGSAEGKRIGASRQEANGGKMSPVSWESNKESVAAARIAKMTLKGADKENQQKGAVVSQNISDKSRVATEASSINTQQENVKDTKVKAKPRAAGVAQIEKAKAEMQPKRGKEKKALEDFPSLTTFKSLADETVTPTWNQEEKKSPATVAPPSSAPPALSQVGGGGKKKKKKKEETQANSVPTVVEQSVQPTWPKGGKSIASSGHPSGVPTVYQKQPLEPQPAVGTWLPNKKGQAAKKSLSSGGGSKSAWANKNSSSLSLSPNDGDFPTLSLSSIASLLGPAPAATTSSSGKKGTKDNGASNQNGKKSSSAVEDGVIPAKTSGKSRKKGNKSEKNVSASQIVPNGHVSNTQSPVLDAATTSPPLAAATKVVVPPSAPVASIQRPPPGIVPAAVNNVINRAAPPPGFNPAPNIHKPPPGFAAPAPLTHQNAMKDYIQPKNYNERNLSLLGKIKDYLGYDDGKLMIFKTVSGDFRRSLISPAEYYHHCQDLLGDNLSNIFSELVSLLPDVTKQQELLQAHQDNKVLLAQQKQKNRVLAISEDKSRTSVGGGGGRKTAGSKAWSGTAEHSTCTQCGQVMLKADMDKHLNSHQDFPSLMSSVGSKSKPIITQPTWGAKIK